MGNLCFTMSFEESLAALSLEGTQGECDSLLTTAQGNLSQGWQLLADGSGQDLMLDIFVLIDPCNLCNVACCSRVCRDQLGLLDQHLAASPILQVEQAQQRLSH